MQINIITKTHSKSVCINAVVKSSLWNSSN